MRKEKPMEVYSAFADIYDRVMRDVDYPRWAKLILRFADQFDTDVQSILELACGTGTLGIKLAKRGKKVVGIDRSEEMLEYAREKIKKERVKIPFYQSDMSSISHLKLDRNFDLIICLYDSINYLLKESQVKSCFADAYKHLRPGGLFIFDVTTEYNLLHNFSGYTFAENLTDASYIWENQYNIQSKICTSKVTIFNRYGDVYNKYIEEHVQRVYYNTFISETLESIGFSIMGTFHNLTDKPVKEKCERIHYVCRKE